MSDLEMIITISYWLSVDIRWLWRPFPSIARTFLLHLLVFSCSNRDSSRKWSCYVQMSSPCLLFSTFSRWSSCTVSMICCREGCHFPHFLLERLALGFSCRLNSKVKHVVFALFLRNGASLDFYGVGNVFSAPWRTPICSGLNVFLDIRLMCSIFIYSFIMNRAQMSKEFSIPFTSNNFSIYMSRFPV